MDVISFIRFRDAGTFAKLDGQERVGNGSWKPGGARTIFSPFLSMQRLRTYGNFYQSWRQEADVPSAPSVPGHWVSAL